MNYATLIQDSDFQSGNSNGWFSHITQDRKTAHVYLDHIGRVARLDQLHRTKLMNGGKKLDAVYTSSTLLTHVQAMYMHVLTHAHTHTTHMYTHNHTSIISVPDFLCTYIAFKQIANDMHICNQETYI